MKRIALTLGAAVVALTAMQATDAQAGGKKFHFGWNGNNHQWNAYYGSPYYYNGGPKFHCFWKKRKIHTPYGWHWKNVKVCKPAYRYY